MIAAALTYFNAFTSGELDPLSTHFVLLGGCICAEVAVAAGIIIEEGWPETCRQKIGVFLILGGVLISAIFTVMLFVFDEGISRAQQRAINDARSETAKAGVTIGTLSGNLDGMVSRLSEAEKAIHELQEGVKTLPPTPSPSAAAVARVYTLTERGARIIRDTTKPGAIVSIIPFMPNLEHFAGELATAFAAGPGIQVAVGHGNLIMNGQTGLIVQYDHANPVSASVFDALVRAGLNPIDGPATPGTPIVFIKVAPPQ